MDESEIKIMIEALELYVKKQKSEIVSLFQIEYQQKTTSSARKQIDASIAQKSACYRKANEIIKKLKEQRHQLLYHE